MSFVCNVCDAVTLINLLNVPGLPHSPAAPRWWWPVLTMAFGFLSHRPITETLTSLMMSPWGISLWAENRKQTQSLLFSIQLWAGFTWTPFSCWSQVSSVEPAGSWQQRRGGCLIICLIWSQKMMERSEQAGRWCVQTHCDLSTLQEVSNLWEDEVKPTSVWKTHRHVWSLPDSQNWTNMCSRTQRGKKYSVFYFSRSSNTTNTLLQVKVLHSKCYLQRKST